MSNSEDRGKEISAISLVCMFEHIQQNLVYIWTSSLDRQTDQTGLMDEKCRGAKIYPNIVGISF